MKLTPEDLIQMFFEASLILAGIVSGTMGFLAILHVL
jgi:hypothetical protein